MSKRKKGKKTRDAIIYQLVRFFVAAGRFLPAWLGHFMGRSLGGLAFHLAKRDRNKAIKNLLFAYGDDLDEKEARKTAKNCFRHLGIMLFEVMKIPALNQKRIEKTLEFQGLEIIQEAIASGRGVIIATGHIGNWELMGAAASRLGVPVNVIARKVNDERLNQLIVKFRQKSGIKTILRESSDSARSILKCLRSGEMLALLIDQDTRVDGAFVPFFGHPAHTPTGAAALAAKTGALYAAASVQRIGIGRHKICVEEIRISDDLDKDHAIIDATAKATELFEKWIREKPEQWAWIHDRWRTKPEAK